MPEIEIVYVLTNQAMPGLIKIGVTNENGLDSRMKQLYTTGVPLPFECFYACKVDSRKNVESALHFAFSEKRINPNREFFRIEPIKVKAILELLNVEDVTEKVEQELSENVTDSERAAIVEMKKRRPPMNFTEMQIPVGSELVFKDGQTTIRVLNEKLIEHNGEVKSLTAATKELLGRGKDDYAVQPSPYWTYLGKNLKGIYDDTYAQGE